MVKTARTKRVLVVEDEKPVAKALVLKLTRAGFDAKAVFDGEEALKTLESERFDLIILDLVMPKMDGFQLLAELQSRKSEIPIIVTSNLSQGEDVKRAKSLGVREYFVKSDTPIADVITHVKRVLSS